MSTLTVTGLRKTYGAVTALADLNLVVDSGTLTAVLGPSGCGKTTLLRCVAGFERPDDGLITVDGLTLAGPRVHVPAHRRGIAVVPQEGALFPHLTIAANVGYGLDRAERAGGRVDEVLELVGLNGYGNRMPHQLSGGQQQRVAVARALAPRPRLLLLDEPFSALDAGLRAGVRDDVRAALRTDGATAILVTHDQAEALSIADQVAVMRDGLVTQAGSPSDVYHRPADPWTARFVGDATTLPGTPGPNGIHCALGVVPDPRGPNADTASLDDGHPIPPTVTVLVRPEQVALTDSGDAPTATVTARDFHGHTTLLRLTLADGTPITARTPGDEPIKPGDTVHLHLTGTPHIWRAVRPSLPPR